jgi:hypothetical protein
MVLSNFDSLLSESGLLSNCSLSRLDNTFDCFDDVIGSSDKVNLKGRQKLMEIENRVGSKSFIYIGDSKKDFVIFKSSISSILISRSRYLSYIAKMKFGKKLEIFAGERCMHGR